jgi:hypothetical protein
MNTKSILKALPTLLLILTTVSISSQLIAQTKGGPNRNHLGQIRFSITSALCDKLKIQNTGESLFKSSSSPGAEVILSYSQPIINGLRLNAGFGWSYISYNYSYHFLIPPGSIFDTGSNSPQYFTTHGVNPREIQSGFTFPITLQQNIDLNRNNSWKLNLEIGIKLNGKESFPYGSGSSSFVSFIDQPAVEYFRFDYNSAGKSNFISYTFKTGLIKYNANNNSFHCNLVLQASPAIFATGSYKFSELGFDSFGTVEQHANYLGLEFAYGLTFHERQKSE